MPPQITKEKIKAIGGLNVKAHPPRVVFDPEQYARDLNEGLNELSRSNPGVTNKAPYSPNDLKAAHNAANINVQPNSDKRSVNIAITIAYNWPADYIQSCFDAMCRVYKPSLTSKKIEVIHLNENGDKASPEEEAAALAQINATVITPVKAYVSSGSTSTTILDSTLNTDVFNASKSRVSDENLEKLKWLGELLLDLWAFAMNPYANISVICGYDSSITSMFFTIMYASDNANFANNPIDMVNMSWGAKWDAPIAYDFSEWDDILFYNPKICYFAATGDERVCTYPSTSPNVLAVGGTSLYYDPVSDTAKGPYHSVWVGQNYAGGGGIGTGTGFAINHSRPNYQKNLPALSKYTINTKRCTPDVSSVADPITGVLIFYTDGTNADNTRILKEQMGGTSLASPIICGLFSHLVQTKINNGEAFTTILENASSVQLQTFLYSTYAGQNMFYDVNDGYVKMPTNSILDVNNSGSSFYAGYGYDIPSGLGVPNVAGINFMLSTTAIVATSAAPAPAPAPAPAAPAPTGNQSSNACGGVGYVPISSHIVSRAGATDCPNCDSNYGYADCVSAAPPYSTYELDQRRKAEILKYKKNGANMSRAAKYSMAARNALTTKKSWATQTQTYTNPNVDKLPEIQIQVNDVSTTVSLQCNKMIVNCSLTSDCDVPGHVIPICMNDQIPLYNYKMQTTYSSVVTKLSTPVFTPTFTTSAIESTTTYTFASILELDINGVTIKYNGPSILNNPTFIKATPRGALVEEWFAIVDNSSKSSITNYAKNDSSTASIAAINAFTPPGQTLPVPFNNIVTTLMTNMSSLFLSTSFNQQIGSWDTSKVATMASMFANSGFNQPIDKWNTSNVTNMASMFQNAAKFDKDISLWNTLRVINMENMFFGAAVFNQPIDKWKTSNVASMASMFASAAKFNQDISSWVTTSVTTMFAMFQNAVMFNQNISGWNTTSVTNMDYMFKNASVFKYNLNDWTVTNVSPNAPTDFCDDSALTPDYEPRWTPRLKLDTNNKTIKYISSIVVLKKNPTFLYENPRGWYEWFAIVNNSSKTSITNYAKNDSAAINAFTSPNVLTASVVPFNNIVTTLVTEMSSLFLSTSFNQQIGSWDTSKVTTMDSMFASATKFNQDISSWDTSKVTTMVSMFQNAIIFNQNISGWNTTSVTNMNYMFKNASVFKYNLNYWTVTKVSPNAPTDFCDDSALTPDYEPRWTPRLKVDANNNKTIKYISSIILKKCPTFLYENPRGWYEWFAVVDTNSNTSNGQPPTLVSGGLTLHDFIMNQSDSVFIPPGQSSKVGLNNVVTTLVTNMDYVFYGDNKIRFIAFIFDSWDTSNVTSMNYMFYNSDFSQSINISYWNVSKVAQRNNFRGGDGNNTSSANIFPTF